MVFSYLLTFNTALGYLKNCSSPPPQKKVGLRIPVQHSGDATSLGFLVFNRFLGDQNLKDVPDRSSLNYQDWYLVDLWVQISVQIGDLTFLVAQGTLLWKQILGQSRWNWPTPHWFRPIALASQSGSKDRHADAKRWNVNDPGPIGLSVRNLVSSRPVAPEFKTLECV